MAKVLSGLTLTAPAAPVAGENGDTFTFTVTPTFTGTASVQGYDLKFLVNPAGAGFVTITTSTGLSSSGTNPIINTTSSTALSITVACAQPGAYTIEAQGAPTTGGSFTVTSSTQTVNVIAPGAYTQDTTLVQKRAAMDHLDDLVIGQPPFRSGIPMAWLQSDYDQTNSRRIAPRHLDNPVVPNRVPTLPPQQPLVDYHDDCELTQSRRRILDEATMPEVAAAAPPRTLVQTHSDGVRLRGPRNNSDISNGPYPVTVPPAVAATQAGPSTVTITEQSVYYPTAIGIAPPQAAQVVTFVDGAHSQQYAKVARLARMLADEARPILVPAKPSAGWIPAASDIRPRAATRAQWDGFAAPPAVAAGEFLVSLVSQWFYPWDTAQRPKPKLLDCSRSEMPLVVTSAPIPSFVSQWLQQHDLRRLASPRAFDRSFATMDGAPKGEFLIAYVSQWGMPVSIRRIARDLLLPPEVADLPLVEPPIGTLFVDMADLWLRGRSTMKTLPWNGEGAFSPPALQPVLIDQWSMQSSILQLSSKMRLSDSYVSVFSAFVRHYVRHIPVGAPFPVRSAAGGQRVTTVKGDGADRTTMGGERR